MSALTDAWQAALAAEHRAVFGYGVLGPQLSGAQQQLAVESSDAHETLRNATEQALASAHLTPVAPLADYPDVYPVRDAAAARVLAVRLEDDCAAAWRYVYLQAAARPGPASADGGVRGAAQRALTASAVRATRWRALAAPAHATTPFPGL